MHSIATLIVYYMQIVEVKLLNHTKTIKLRIYAKYQQLVFSTFCQRSSLQGTKGNVKRRLLKKCPAFFGRAPF